jgi:hypothetical protein
MLVSLLIGIAPACNGGGVSQQGSTPPHVPAVLLFDDLSSGNLNNWNIGGQIVFDGTNGNPAPAIQHQGGLNGKATSLLSFSPVNGLTISFDYKMTIASGTVTFGGLNGGSDASPAEAAGFSISEASLSCVLNGATIQTATPPDMANWNSYAVQILSSGIVKYFVNDVLIFTSAGTLSPPNSNTVVLLVTGTSFGNLSFFDNVRVIGP